MTVVTNATPLIALSLVNRLPLLRELFREVLAPPSVYNEVAIAGVGRPGAATFTDLSWIRVHAPQASTTIEPMLLGLDSGELDVLLLAREVRPAWVLIDERLARRIARAMGLPVKGTVGVLLSGFRAGFLSKREAMEALQELLVQGIRIGPALIDWFAAQLDSP